MAAGALFLGRQVCTPPPLTASELRIRALIERIKEDDALAFEELYRLTRDDVARTLAHLLGRRTDLEDLIQETYVRLLKTVRGFRGESKFMTFLYRVCANVALMHLRWWRRRREAPLEELAEEPIDSSDPERAAQAAQASRLVHRALEALSAKKRIVFVYSELCGMGPEEISEVLEIPYNTVRSRLLNARAEFEVSLAKLVTP